MRWIINEKYLYLLNLLLNSHVDNNFFKQEENITDDSSSDGIYDGSNDGLNNNPRKRRDIRV